MVEASPRVASIEVLGGIVRIPGGHAVASPVPELARTLERNSCFSGSARWEFGSCSACFAMRSVRSCLDFFHAGGGSKSAKSSRYTVFFRRSTKERKTTASSGKSQPSSPAAREQKSIMRISSTSTVRVPTPPWVEAVRCTESATYETKISDATLKTMSMYRERNTDRMSRYMVTRTRILPGSYSYHLPHAEMVTRR